MRFALPAAFALALSTSHAVAAPVSSAAYADEAVKRLQRQAEAQRAGKS